MTPEIDKEDYSLNLPITHDIKRYEDGSMEALVHINNRAHPIAWTRSYGPEFVNPQPSVVPDLLKKTSEYCPRIHTLLTSLQSDDRCAANCRGCVFANHRNRNLGQKAVPIDADHFIQLIDGGIALGEQSGLISHDQKIRVNPLLSGDPSFNANTYQLIALTACHPRVEASRWSTIAAKNSHKVLEQFVDVARAINERDIIHKLRFQVSLHSTDEDTRNKHVTWYGTPESLSLYSAEEINEAFKKIYSFTGQASTLAFVVHHESSIDPHILSQKFDSKHTYISLRPLVQTDANTAPLSEGEFIDLYQRIRTEGFNVVVMPTVNGIEQDNLIRNSGVV